IRWDTVGRNGMLIGSFEHTVDEKSRLSIPSAWRKHLETELYVTRGLEQCLFIFSSQQFNENIQQVQQLPFTDKNARFFMRIFSSGASQPAELDKQGRILIPQSLKNFAEIDKEVILVGMVTRIELWSPKHWNTFYSQQEASFEEVAENIFHHVPKSISNS
ncbi:MAG: division/cell wall cluster transcriptional repressor MraZ, partial [Candidatus Brocadiales bacterium]